MLYMLSSIYVIYIGIYLTYCSNYIIVAPRRSKFKGRLAHVSRSSRECSRWDTPVEAVFVGSLGDLTSAEYLAKAQNLDPKERFSAFRGDLKCYAYSQRSCTCGGRIEINRAGKAVCSLCQTIFNDGGNTYDKDGNSLVKTVKKYSDHRPDDIIIKKKGLSQSAIDVRYSRMKRACK